MKPLTTRHNPCLTAEPAQGLSGMAAPSERVFPQWLPQGEGDIVIRVLGLKAFSVHLIMAKGIQEAIPEFKGLENCNLTICQEEEPNMSNYEQPVTASHQSQLLLAFLMFLHGNNFKLP